MPDPIVFADPPAPGTALPGDLYVDLQSRSLWLGVDTAVDPAGAVLISDIAAMLANDTATLNSAKAYTDSAIATRAPLAHTHTAAQVTDFTAAVQSVVSAMPSANFMPGMIMLWGGPLTAIGVGNLAGWALCDGQAAPTLPGGVTPNLKDRFVIGAGNLVPGDKNSAVVNPVTDAKGAHNHGGVTGDTALTVAMLPSHNHSAGSFAFSDTTSSNGAHTHGLISMPAGADYDTYGRKANTSAQSGAEGGASDANLVAVSESAGAHTHTVSGAITGTSGSTGTGAIHNHTIGNVADHTHTITAAAIRAAVLWYALAYIVKL